MAKKPKKPKSPPTIESIIKGINSKLKNTFTTFGGAKSREYNNVLKIITTAFTTYNPETDAYETINISSLLREAKDVPTQVSRSKRIYDFWEFHEHELRSAYNAILDLGSINKMIGSRIDSMEFLSDEQKEAWKKEPQKHIEIIQSNSISDFASSFEDSDLYETLNALLDFEESLPEHLKDYKYIGGIERALSQFSGHMDREYRYGMALREFLKAKAEHEMTLRERLVDGSDAPFEYQDEPTDERKYDMSI